MELLEMIGAALTGALATGGSVAAYFKSREADAGARQAEAEAEPATDAELNKRILLLFTRLASVENRLEQEQALRIRLQEQVFALQAERDQLRDDLAERDQELAKLRTEVARLRTEVEGR